MKTHLDLKTFGFFILLTLVLGTGCSDSDLPLTFDQNQIDKTHNSSHISRGEALEIANRFLNRPLLSRFSGMEVDFQYVVKSDATRSACGFSDTLAYVINYPNNMGFAIIASDRRVNPVLAFAQEGEFTFENEVSKANFIDRIGFYMESSKDSEPLSNYPSILEDCFIINPVPQTSLSQNAPFNKYVDIEHPGYPTGCVAVATALIMLHAKSELEYHETVYHCKSIMEALSSKRDINTRHIYTYEQAVDSIAKIMYWIGKDTGMKYENNAGSTYIDSVFNLLLQLDYKPSKIQRFKNEIAFNYVKDNYMLYMRGVDTIKLAGHAWICDGGAYCVDNKNRPTKIIDRYFHCDWGWGGYCNGNFSGKVFSPVDIINSDTLNFIPMQYFAVSRGLGLVDGPVIPPVGPSFKPKYK